MEGTKKTILRIIGLILGVWLASIIVIVPLVIGFLFAGNWLRQNAVGSWAEPFYDYREGLLGLPGALACIGFSALLDSVYRRYAVRRRGTMEEQLGRADAIFDTYMRETVLEDPDAKRTDAPADSTSPVPAPTSS